MWGRFSAAVFALILSFGGWLAPSRTDGATSVTLQPSSRDAYIDEASPTLNFGTDQTLRVRSKTSSRQRFVIQFDLSTIPSDAGVKTATLSVFMNQAPTTSRTYGAHRITGTTLWTETGVTWNSRDGTTSWTTAGGDFNAATSTSDTGTTVNVWLNWDIKADVQAWVDGSTTSNGILIKDGSEGSTDERSRFASKEDGTAANRPKLAVSYLRKVQNLTATAGNGQVSLSWTLPGGSPDYNGTLIIRKAGSAPTSTPTDGTNYSVGATLSDGSVVILNDTTLATTFTDTGLTNGTTHYYQAFARDSSVRYSLGSAVVSATPTCTAVSDASYVTANAQTGQATVYWSSPNPALILRKTAPFAGEAPAGGQTYAVNDTIGAATVVYNASVAETSFSQTGLTNGTVYYYKVFPKTGSGGTSCYAPGVEVNASPPAGTHPAWSYMMAGGSILKGGTAGSGTIYATSNASRIISLNTADGTQSWQPVSTTAAIQGWLVWVPVSGGTSTAVLGGDQSGKVYSVNTATGAKNWEVQLPAPADAVQAAAAVQVRDWSDAAFQAAYTTDVIFAATRNSSTTNNKVFALRASDGAVLWTFNGTGVYSVDYIVGMPYVDYSRNRVYIASRAGSSGTQSSLWVINSLDGTLVQSFTLGHLESSPTLSYDGATLYVGNTAGDLYAINAATLALKWTSPSALGTATKGFVWEDFTTAGRLYFSTADGNVWCLQDPGAGAPPNPATPVWKTPVAGPSTPVLLDALYVGSSDGKVHQINLTTGLEEKQYTVGDGTATVGDASTEDGNQIFVGTTAGKLYKLPLPLP